MSIKRIVIKKHTSNYPSPIILNVGDNILLGREDDEYIGWMFCTNIRTGLSGWCPKQIINVLDNTNGIAIEDYSANELNVIPGQELIIIKELNDWAWCYDSVNFGWVPLDNFK